LIWARLVSIRQTPLTTDAAKPKGRCVLRDVESGVKSKVQETGPERNTYTW
jgi:hypothetical protein